jgi:hypothetical protein
MNTSTTQARHPGMKAGKIVMAIALASAIGGLGMTPAFGAENSNRGRDGNRDHATQNRGHNTDRGRHDNRPQNRSTYRYEYAQPVYVPPPIYYAPQPSPGISLFFPLNLR